MTEKLPVSLAVRIKELREAKGLTLEELAVAADVSKTYLWELEKDSAGEKKPSAAVLLEIARALSTTLADLLSLPSLTVRDQKVEIPQTLREFAERMDRMGTTLSTQDMLDLASMKFRGGQPQSVDEWHSLYFALTAATRKSD